MEFHQQLKTKITSLYTNSIINITFVTMVFTQFNIKVKCIKSDNGNEFKLTNFYNKNGISYHNSCVGIPQQNGIVERKYQLLLAITRVVLFQSNLQKKKY